MDVADTKARMGQGGGLMAAVLDHLRKQLPARPAGSPPLAEEELARLATGFVEAGGAWLACTLQPGRWTQINVKLDLHASSPGMMLVTGRLQDTVESWIAEGLLNEFHFLFKPPGMRLRFMGDSARLCVRIDTLCGMLIQDGAFSTYTKSPYDCETYQFGGAAGLAAAHRFFTAESLAVLRYWRLLSQGGARMGAPEFSLTLLDLFLRNTVEDEWELWDVWCRMDLTGRRTASFDHQRAADLTVAGEDLVQLLRRKDPELGWVPQAERLILLAFMRQASPVADHWRQLHIIGRLLFPLREILPFLIVFHFNRMCLGSEQQRSLSFVMQSLLSPKLTPPLRTPAR